jgi:hypothetical protein
MEFFGVRIFPFVVLLCALFPYIEQVYNHRNREE